MAQDDISRIEAETRQQRAAAVDLVRDLDGVDHIWLNAFKCVAPTDEFLRDVGREVVSRVMAQNHPDLDVLRHRRHVVIRINAS